MELELKILAMPNIYHEVIIGTSSENVYRALTSQEGLSAWWTPQTTTSAEVGSLARFGFGPQYFKEMRIDKLLSPEYVEWSCLAGADEWIGTTIKFTIKHGNKAALTLSNPEIADQLQQQRENQCTLLRLEHNDWKGYTSMFAECNYTWGQFLRSIKLYCETGKGRPWPHQHAVS